MKLESIIDTAGLSIGRQLRLKRVLEGKTQDELSKELNIPQSTLSKYETEERSLQGKHYQIVFDFLNNGTK